MAQSEFLLCDFPTSQSMSGTPVTEDQSGEGWFNSQALMMGSDNNMSFLKRPEATR